MNKLLKLLKKEGKNLGAGCERRSYLYNGKVYKVPFGDGEQGVFEQDVYSLMPDKFKIFFPNPEFIGRITKMDYVEIAVKHRNIDAYYYYDGYGEWDIFNNWGDSILAKFCEDYGIIFDWSLFEDFMIWFKDQGGLLVDILSNPGNWGWDPVTKELKIVDWGWSSRNSCNYGYDYSYFLRKGSNMEKEYEVYLDEERDHSYIFCPECGEKIYLDGEYEYGFYFNCKNGDFYVNA